MGLERCEDIKQLRRELAAISSVVAGDTKFAAKALMFMAERLNAMKPPKRKQKPSAWNRFVAAGNRAGKSMKQIASEWRAKKLKLVG